MAGKEKRAHLEVGSNEVRGRTVARETGEEFRESGETPGVLAGERRGYLFFLHGGEVLIQKKSVLSWSLPGAKKFFNFDVS